MERRYLDMNELEGEVPPELANLKELKTLYVILNVQNLKYI